uniref:Uncharacterized protein n=1 Tax=Utricularia reniformis TaxID=192314 RepID=A0A1Y0B074_9LAMI|nr:hypothetical protein AEK19_MT0515 [Utricularia reniformis]ART30771.1 hypothetical protein AEK19_MT0515 [Utricularia reniformis]
MSYGHWNLDIEGLLLSLDTRSQSHRYETLFLFLSRVHRALSLP